MDIKAVVSEVESKVIEWRRHLHKIPEIALELPKTADYVCKVLDEIGVEYERGVGTPHSVVAKVKGGRESGKVMAIRADMDALEVVEQTGLPFASDNGCMHACGHDAHTAILLGAVWVINSLKDEFGGEVKFLFQPAEESGEGARLMAGAGAVDDADFVIGLHVGNTAAGYPSGKLLLSDGPMMASSDFFCMKIKGYGSHAGYPHKGKDSVVIGSYIVTALQEIAAREVDPTESAVITVGRITSGTTFNVIPNEAYLEGTARATTKEVRELILRRIGEIGENVAKAFRAELEYSYIWNAPPVVNDKEVAERVYNAAIKVFDKDDVVWMKKPVMGAEDFSEYLERKPGAFMFLSTPMEIDGEVFPHHNPRFALDESQFRKGVELFTQVAADYLGNDG